MEMSATVQFTVIGALTVNPMNPKLSSLIEKTGDDIRGSIVEMTSKMLNNPDENGIYSTTKFYERMENYIKYVRSTAQTEAWEAAIRWFMEEMQERANHVPPNLLLNEIVNCAHDAIESLLTKKEI